MLKYNILHNDNEIIAEIETILGKKININSTKKIVDAIPSKPWFTATTQMKDFIGRIKSFNYNNKICNVFGFYMGREQNINGVKLFNIKDFIVGERVMVTEHININGNLELIATKNRILEGDINFINIGWIKNGKIISQTIIDAYTGDFKEIQRI